MNTDAKRFYALLGVHPSCSDEDIRTAFRRRAKELHPDAETGDAVAFIRLKRAYDTLIDPAARARYDRVSTARLRRASFAAEPPPPPRARAGRSGGVSIRRYFVAFLLIGGLSFGAIQAMISYAEIPAPSAPHPVSLLSRETGKEASLGDGRAASAAPTGFWDTTTADGSPRSAPAEARIAPRKQLGSFGAE